MNPKQQVLFQYHVDTNMSEYNIRSNILDKYIKEFDINARTAMRFDPLLNKYKSVTKIEINYTSGISIVIAKLAAIINGLYDLEKVVYQIGLEKPQVQTDKALLDKKSWYPELNEEELN